MSKSTSDALNKFCARDAKSLEPKVGRKAKNDKPEFEFKKAAKRWLTANGFKCDVVESKAVWSKAAGDYLSGQARAGFSDLVGVTPYFGVACYIELKAPGKRSTLKPHQRDFLIGKIEAGAFGVCVDSVELLESLYSAWLNIRKSKVDLCVSADYLISWLPKIKELKDNLADITEA